MRMTTQVWEFLNAYSHEVFGEQDEHLAGLMVEATAAGLPDIAVSADVGRLLMILTRLARAERVIEVGTLAGYSGIWLARGLQPGGRLYTVELNPDHAAFAQRQFETAGVADRVEIRQGPALEVLPALAGELGPSSIDVLFLDAEKVEYSDYWRICRPMIKPGGLVIADNVLGSNQWSIPDVDHPNRRAADALNRLVAGDPEFEAVAIPLRAGVLVGLRSN